MIARLLHGWRHERATVPRCCGRRWNDLPRHLSFAHGEKVVIPEPFVSYMDEPTPPCRCGAPATGWTYQVMGDGQTINGLAVCAAHQEKQP